MKESRDASEVEVEQGNAFWRSISISSHLSSFSSTCLHEILLFRLVATAPNYLQICEIDNLQLINLLVGCYPVSCPERTLRRSS
jgi:hypothetical protein